MRSPASPRNTISVKVPPISTPTRNLAIGLFRGARDVGRLPADGGRLPPAAARAQAAPLLFRRRRIDGGRCPRDDDAVIAPRRLAGDEFVADIHADERRVALQ